MKSLMGPTVVEGADDALDLDAVGQGTQFRYGNSCQVFNTVRVTVDEQENKLLVLHLPVVFLQRDGVQEAGVARPSIREVLLLGSGEAATTAGEDPCDDFAASAHLRAGGSRRQESHCALAFSRPSAGRDWLEVRPTGGPSPDDYVPETQ